VTTRPTDSGAITWLVGDTEFHFRIPAVSPPLLMGIVNTTPDSFSDGGQFVNADAAVAHALTLIQEGAGIIDVGGQSTRPGSEPVPLNDELDRVLPAIEALRARSDVLISIDTSKAEVARQAIAAGARIINDVTALTEDPAMIDVACQSRAGIMIMHMPGTPKTMQQFANYDDVTGVVRSYLGDRLDAIESRGISRARVAIDPGIGFGKLLQHNLSLVRDIGRLTDLGRPVCLGASRKGFIGDVLGRPRGQRDVGTAAVSLAAYQRGACILRVHDVATMRDVIAMTRAIDRGFPLGE
jgi:dihydropteroate synthase